MNKRKDKEYLTYEDYRKLQNIERKRIESYIDMRINSEDFIEKVLDIVDKRKWI